MNKCTKLIIKVAHSQTLLEDTSLLQTVFFVPEKSPYAGAPRARFARAWAEPHSLVNLPIPENLVIM